MYYLNNTYSRYLFIFC